MTKKLILLLIVMLIWTTAIPTYAFSSTIAYKEIKTEDSVQELLIEAVEIFTKAFVNFKLSQLTNNVEKTSDDTIKILTIGNSFSQDMDYYLYDIAKSAGVNIIVGNLYNSGCSLERHWTYASNNDKAYSYYKWKNDEMTKTENVTLKEAVLDERWDYITFQQSSANSGMYATYQPYLNKMLSYVKKIARNQDVKFALNMTWAYASISTNDGFFNYHYNQNTMYNAIINSYKYALEDSKINIIVPCGTAIQNARTNKYLTKVGKELTSDGYHLDTGIGRYIAGLTMFNTIINEEGIKLDINKDVKFIPSTKEGTERLVNLAKKAVKNAVMYPYDVREIK